MNDIQPSEDLLKKESVDYFLANPVMIFSSKKKILISKSKDPRFNYFVVDGNNRLYACFKLGYKLLYIIPDYGQRFYAKHPDDIGVVIDTLNRGVKQWIDFKERIVPSQKFEEIMSVRD